VWLKVLRASDPHFITKTGYQNLFATRTGSRSVPIKNSPSYCLVQTLICIKLELVPFGDLYHAIAGALVDLYQALAGAFFICTKLWLACF